MTIPTVASITGSGSASKSTTHTVDYPATVNAGDLLLLLYSNEDQTAAPTFPGSYATNELVNESTGFSFRVATSYIIAAGTEGSGSINITTSTSEVFSALMVRIENWHGTTVPEIGARNASSSGSTQAVSLTPSGWDSSADDTLWVWFFSNDNRADQQVVNTFPPEMPDNNTNYWPTGADACSLAMATDDTSGASRSVAAQISNLSQFDGHNEVLIGIRGVVASSSTDVNLHGIGRGISRGVARGIG